MEVALKKALVRLGNERVKFDCPMKQYTTFRVGGNVEALYEAINMEDLKRLLSLLKKEATPYLVLGGGSNLLVRDNGLKGVAIILKGTMAEINQQDNGEGGIQVGGGLPLSGLLTYCRHEGLGGLEFLAGIPGTVGGALMMNAGAFGESIGERVKRIWVISTNGEFIELTRKQLKFSYREVAIQEGTIIVLGYLSVEHDSSNAVGDKIRKYHKRRKQTQPLEYSSAGCIFKNPPGKAAGKLIEETGLKGKAEGDAVISEKHANWIVNTGNASAEDIITLLDIARDRVKEHTGVDLELEVRIVGY